jgi:hypothetical protein
MPSAHGSRVDSFFPVVSALAFLSGSCFGFFFAGRAHRLW